MRRSVLGCRKARLAPGLGFRLAIRPPCAEILSPASRTNLSRNNRTLIIFRCRFCAPCRRLPCAAGCMRHNLATATVPPQPASPTRASKRKWNKPGGDNTEPLVAASTELLNQLRGNTSTSTTITSVQDVPQDQFYCLPSPFPGHHDVRPFQL